MKTFDDKKDHIISVSKFLKISNRELDPTHVRWIFRGEPKFDYSLRPSVGRLLDKNPFPLNKEGKKKLFDFEQQAFKEFFINSRYELEEDNHFIVLAAAQHHGLKTRLLDWTFSALTGLFFAVEDEEKMQEPGSLIALMSPTFNEFQKKATSPFAKNLNEYEFMWAPALSPRIRVQQGVFQLFKNPTVEFVGNENLELKKFKIPASCKKVIKRELEFLGISYKTLFPDLDGLCKTINYNKLYGYRK